MNRQNKKETNVAADSAKEPLSGINSREKQKLNSWILFIN